jgi:uncharacterized membrane protein YkvI
MAKVKGGNINIFTIAATYMGTIVGAGFASGQEVLQFFSVYGRYGIWAVLLTTIMFIFFGYYSLMLGHKLKATSHVEVIRFANGRYLGFIVDLVITVFLFGALSAMIAGAGAVFEEQFGWSPLLGNILMAVITLLTVWTGISGVVNAISYVVPVLLAAIIYLTYHTLTNDPITASDWQLASTLEGAAPNWLVAAINYVSYNLVIAVAVLAPIGAKAKSGKTLFWGAMLGGLSLGAGVMMIFFAVLSKIDIASAVEIPMIQVAAGISVIFQLIFSVILFAEIYTTAVGNLFGFVARLSKFWKLKDKWIMAGTTAAAFAVSQLGFSTMVKYLYPSVGYGGMILLAGLTLVWILRRHTKIRSD